MLFLSLLLLGTTPCDFELKSLVDSRNYISEISSDLDPDSRYISELLKVLDGSRDLSDFEARMSSTESRGRKWAGESGFEKMNLKEKIRSNLITNETTQVRFSTDELRFFRGPFVEIYKKQAGVKILSLPSSNGAEAVSIAHLYFLAGLRNFKIRGLDIQPAMIEIAKSGVIEIDGGEVLIVSPLLTPRLEFSQADVFQDSIGENYDQIFCRNFLGYFKPEQVLKILQKLLLALKPQGFLIVDPFILRKHPEVFHVLPLDKVKSLPIFRKING